MSGITQVDLLAANVLCLLKSKLHLQIVSEVHSDNINIQE